MTFTSHKNFYTTIVADFINAINSLEILNPEDQKIKPQTKVAPVKKDIQANDLEPIDVADDYDVETVEEENMFTTENITIGLIAICVLLLVLKVL